MRDVKKVPRAVEMSRIYEAIRSLDMPVQVGDENEVSVNIIPHVFYIVAEESKPFLGFSIFHRSIDVRYAREAAQIAQAHNRDFYLPKLFTVVTDDGKIRFRISHCFSWDGGATDQQIADEINVFFHSGFEAFGRLEAAFPDPWSLSEEEEE